MSLNSLSQLAIIDLKDISKRYQGEVSVWNKIPINEHLTFVDTPIHPELGGGVCGLYNLGPGRLSLLGFVQHDSKIIFQSTRLGLMPSDWNPPDYIVDNLCKLLTLNTNRSSEDCVFHVAADWDWNFQHFLTEYIPRLLWLTEFVKDWKDVVVTVSDHPYIFEILDVCFPKIKFIKIKQNDIIEITSACYFVPPLFKNIGHHTAYSEHAMRFLRESHLSAWLSKNKPALFNKKRKVFFGRKIMNGYAGNSRVLTNEDEIFSIAMRNGFEKVYFDDMTILEKMDLMATIGYAIMPTGANIMNLLFAPFAFKVGIIMHPIFRPINWFQHTMSVGGSPIEELICFSDVQISDDHKSESNSPYMADPKSFDLFIKQLINN